MKKTMKVFAPGKLILSGEHSVVYGKPALAMAVNRYVMATAKREDSKLISFDLSDLSYAGRFSFSSLEQLKNRIKQKYHHFMHGDFKIREVLQKPFELAQFALSLCLEMLNIKLTEGMQIHVESTIPIGCGMGSSAATILSIIYAITKHLGVNLPTETFLRLALEAENAQHGISSGLDLRVSLYGGCVYLNNKILQSRPIPTFPMYLVNTGTPESNTGECVTRVAPHFLKGGIGDDFAAITDAMDALLRTGVNDFKKLIRANHELLVEIGVVPLKIQKFIHDIEQMDGGAKICGAGAVTGNNAGMVLIAADDVPALHAICQKYSYEILPIAVESRGVHVDSFIPPSGVGRSNV
jgi:mevalonate kinase